MSNTVPVICASPLDVPSIILETAMMEEKALPKRRVAPFMPFPNRRVAAWVATAQTIAIAGEGAQLTSVGVQPARGIDGWYVDLQGPNLKFGRGQTLRARAMEVAEIIGWELAETGAFPAYPPSDDGNDDLHDYIVGLITQHATIFCAIAEKLTAAATKIAGEELANHLAVLKGEI